VVTKSFDLWEGFASSGPGGVVNSWYNTEKITGRIVTYEGTTERNDVHRGDICKVGDDYYVFNDGGSVAHSPTTLPIQWYKLP
ncbi:MAG: hypothetical protein PHU31_10620, partial [Anaerotignum sp.]|nr:hypothetical protein [Anaerotignum sp.]